MVTSSNFLHRNRLFVFPSGVKNADENELKAIASPPEETHVYNVADFSVMSNIVEGLTKTVCDRVDQLDKQIKGNRDTGSRDLQGAVWYEHENIFKNQRKTTKSERKEFQLLSD